jgi:hypothetical protein
MLPRFLNTSLRTRKDKTRDWFFRTRTPPEGPYSYSIGCIIEYVYEYHFFEYEYEGEYDETQKEEGNDTYKQSQAKSFSIAVPPPPILNGRPFGAKYSFLVSRPAALAIVVLKSAIDTLSSATDLPSSSEAP